MTNEFYDTFKNYSKEELFKIVLSQKDYQPQALSAAKRLIAENNWVNDLKKKTEQQNIETEKEEELYEEDVKEKAEYYKNEVEFKEQGNSFQIRITDIPKLEAALLEKNIEFFREDKNIGAQLDVYPTQSYYFKNEDIDAVDKITKDLNILTVPYADIKPFFNFEVKAVLIAFAIGFLILLLSKIYPK